jgi:predicted RNA-binding Zn-ribbon protein involved in translation (DUF1610 family)
LQVACEITTKADWLRFNGAWKWGVAIPIGDEVVRIVCPKCGSANAQSDRVSNHVYGWCDQYCGWQDGRRITNEWKASWQALLAKRNQVNIRS